MKAKGGTGWLPRSWQQAAELGRERTQPRGTHIDWWHNQGWWSKGVMPRARILIVQSGVAHAKLATRTDGQPLERQEASKPRGNSKEEMLGT
jgi:hypothetical protein